METGSSLLERPSKQPCSPSLSVQWNMQHGKCTSHNFLPQFTSHNTNKSLSLIKQPNSMSPIKNTFTSLTLPNLTTFKPPSSLPLAWVQVAETGQNVVTNGIVDLVTNLQLNANMSMHVTNVDVGVHIRDQSVPELEFLNDSIARGQKFRRKMIWEKGI
ncbi:hypothetical protein PAXRUDRAFT_770686, partial [Paxillus rubicundulus Ve08.2h10]